MDYISVSLYVLLGAAVLAAVVLLLTRRAEKQREEELQSYCAQNGYRLTIRREPTAREIQLEGDGWHLVSSMRALQNTAQTGSSDWKRETEWVCTKEDPKRQTFALQVSQGTTDLDSLPTWLRESALCAMRAWLGGDLQNVSSVRTAFCEGGRTGLVFETGQHAADAALERLVLALRAYHGGLPLYLECSPVRFRSFLPDAAVKTAPEIESLLNIAFSLC